MAAPAPNVELISAIPPATRSGGSSSRMMLMPMAITVEPRPCRARPVSIIGTTVNERAWRKLNLSWGVTPVLSENYTSIDVMFWQDLKVAQQLFELKKGDNVVMTGGQINGEPGNTNTIKVETIK